MKMNILVKQAMQCVMPVLLTLCVAAGADGAGEPPDTVTLDVLQELYEPVIFDHAMHMDGYDCAACHHHTMGDGTEHPVCSLCHKNSDAAEHVNCSACHDPAGSRPSPPENLPQSTYHIDKPGLKGALHLQCVGCHNSEGGPTGCRECHEFTPAGKKRFMVTEPK